MHVLIVDDYPDAADLLQELLHCLGHEVQVAYTGESALEACRAWCPEVVLCALNLPGMSGYSLCEQVRADTTLAGTRLIALTGYEDDETRRRTAAAGFEAHLVKPIDPHAVHALLLDRRN